MNLWEENNPNYPLLTFDSNDDYIYDCKFHTTNPSLFACVDGSGKLDFWDLNKDVECPVYRHEVGKDALNKLNWSHDGKRIAVGDINGKINVMTLDRDIVNCKQEESNKFQRVIDKHRNIGAMQKTDLENNI
jgi:dynein intermediate chain